MNRRRILHALAAAPLAALGPRLRAAEPPAPAPAPTPTSTPAPASAPRLVVVLLRGGLDGLSAVVPYADADYRAARPKLALGAPGTAGGVLDLDGRFGLHPALAPLLPLWTAGLFGCVHACGSPDPTRSHFDAQDDLDTGTPGRRATASGWLNRLLAELPGAGGPTAGLALGAQIPRLLSGPRPVAMLASGRGAGRASAMDRPGLADTLVVVLSEFGRTVRENGNSGTDHGHGNVVWLLGGRIHGGRVHGDWPGLAESARWQGRDLAVTTDFRAVLWTALGAHFALDAAALARILPGYTAAGGGLPDLMA